MYPARQTFVKSSKSNSPSAARETSGSRSCIAGVAWRASRGRERLTERILVAFLRNLGVDGILPIDYGSEHVTQQRLDACERIAGITHSWNEEKDKEPKSKCIFPFPSNSPGNQPDDERIVMSERASFSAAQFFDSQPKPPRLEEHLENVLQFVTKNLNNGKRVVLITVRYYSALLPVGSL